MSSPPTDPTPTAEPEIIPAQLRKKRGPNTGAGREAVRLNAVRHGLAARAVCVPGLEDPAEWEAFRDAIIDSLEPEGALEEALASMVAETHWRLRRVAPAEAEAIAVARERVARDYFNRSGIVRPPSVEEGERRLQAAREALEVFAAYYHDPENNDPTTAYLSPDAIHEFIAAVVGNDPATPTLSKPVMGDALSGVLGMIGEHAKKLEADPELLGDEVLERLERGVQMRQGHLDDLVAELDRMTRERLLPPEQNLTHITRHEAHLNRQLSQYMNQLEALQSRRRGIPTPLARVHFTTGV